MNLSNPDIGQHSNGTKPLDTKVGMNTFSLRKWDKIRFERITGCRIGLPEIVCHDCFLHSERTVPVPALWERSHKFDAGAAIAVNPGRDVYWVERMQMKVISGRTVVISRSPTYFYKIRLLCWREIRMWSKTGSLFCCPVSTPCGYCISLSELCVVDFLI